MPVARNKILKFSQNHKSMKNLCHLHGQRMFALKLHICDSDGTESFT